MKKHLLNLMVLLLSIAGYSQTTFIDNFIEYEVTSSSPPYEVKVIGNTGSGGAINIPATVMSGGFSYSVTAIDNSAFFASNLTSVVIPDSVLSIGSSAFSNNNNLVTATIGNSVTSIANSAFFGADLSSVIIPDSVLTIGNQAFDFNSLTSLTLGANLTSIGNNTFANNSLTSVVFPQSLLSISGEAFDGNQLSNVTIPENVTTIEGFAFSGNPITTVTSLSQTPPTITNQVFGGRANIDLIIPTGTATAYSATAGAKWSGFKTVSDSVFLTFTINDIVYEVTSTINNTAKTVDYLNYGSSNNVIIPTTVTSNSIVYTVTEIENYSFRGSGSSPQTISSVVIPDGITRIGLEAFRFNPITSLTIPDSVEIIGNFSFMQNTSLSNVTLGSNVTTIGDGAFDNCNMSTIVLPSSLSSIGFQAFQNNQLSTVTIPGNVTSVGYNAFTGNVLTSVTSLAITPPTIVTGTLDTFDTRSGIDLNIPSGTTGVYVTDPSALWTGFNTVTEAPAPAIGDTFVVDFITYEITSLIPDTVQAIDYDMSGGTVVNIPTTVDNSSVTYTVTEIGDNAFFNNQLTSIFIPSSVISIGFQSFRSNSLTDITIPGSVNTIGSSAFTGNSNLSTVTIENGVETINNSAFFSCGLTSVSIPNSVLSIGNQAFDANNLSSVILGDSVEAISFGAFRNNQITTITFPASVTTIGNLAFQNNLLTDVYSESLTPPTILTGTIGASDTFDDRSGINLNIPSGTTGAYVTDPGALWTGFNTVTEAQVPAVGDTFVVDFITYEITSLIPDTVQAIDYDMAGGTVVNIPTTVDNSSVTYTVTEIGDSAFFNNQLTSIVIPSSVISIGFQSFRSNSLTDITIPGSVNTIGSSAFTGNSNLSTVTIEDGVETINNSAFFACGLTSVSIPNSVLSIGNQAFDANNLSSVILGDSVEAISFGAFRNNQITTITFPASVTTIGNLAFQNNLLTDVYSESLTPPTILTGTIGASDTFDDRSGIDLFIPTGTTGAYVTDPGAQWTGFNSVTEDPTLSTSNFELENEIKVIRTLNTIEIKPSNSIKLKDYSIYNMSGVKIASGSEREINTSSLASGIYILKMEFNKGTLIKKVVIK